LQSLRAHLPLVNSTPTSTSQPNDHALTVALAWPPAQNPTPFAQRINTQCPYVLRQRHRRSEDDTKKSFDFTDELKKMNESGGSDRLSFIERLENVFRTPANLRYDSDLQIDAPPVTKIMSLQAELQAELERAGDRRSR
jgi:hypothetical protein